MYRDVQVSLKEGCLLSCAKGAHSRGLNVASDVDDIFDYLLKLKMNVLKY